MEIKLEKELNNSKFKIDNLEIKSKEITSIIGNNYKNIDELFNIIINSSKSVHYMKTDFYKMFNNINILEDIKHFIVNLDKDKLYELIKEFKLNDSILNKNYLELSSGEKQKICIIISLLKKSKVIILNNPTSYLDYSNIQTLIKNLKRLKKDKIIIISSNDMDFILKVTDRLVVLKDLKIIADSSKIEILKNEKIMNEIKKAVPDIIDFENYVLKEKNIKLGYRDNINDLIKDIYRYAK